MIFGSQHVPLFLQDVPEVTVSAGIARVEHDDLTHLPFGPDEVAVSLEVSAAGAKVHLDSK